MSNSELILGFGVGEIEVVGIPRPKNINNEFDEFGLVVFLDRLSKEKNVDYKRRLKDVYIHRGNATYNGLIFAITRDLGLPLLQPIRIYPLKDGGGAFIATDPAVIFDSTKVTLFSDKKN